MYNFVFRLSVYFFVAVAWLERRDWWSDLVVSAISSCREPNTDFCSLVISIFRCGGTVCTNTQQLINWPLSLMALFTLFLDQFLITCQHAPTNLITLLPADKHLQYLKAVVAVAVVAAVQLTPFADRLPWTLLSGTPFVCKHVWSHRCWAI